MKRLLVLAFSALMMGDSYSQNQMMVFKPSGGANDGTDQGSLMGGKDTWANRFSPGENYGAEITALGTPRSNCNPSDYKSYFQFDLATLPSIVDSVFFGVHHMEHTQYCYSNCDADFYFYYLTSAWDEMTLVPNNEPTEDLTPFHGPINITFPNNFGNQEHNITNAYNQWKTGSLTNNGFTIYSPTVGCNNAAVYFGVSSSDETDDSLRPYLKVYYSIQTSVSEQAGANVQVYPNPFSDYLQVSRAAFDSYAFYDLTGRKCEVEYVPESNVFDTNRLVSGIYILRMVKEGKPSNVRLIKR